MISKSHYYFLLNFSPWPLISSLSSFNLLFSFLLFIKFTLVNSFLLALINASVSCFIWWFFYSGEMTLEGLTSLNLEQGIKFSMILFISSEIFFFFSFFWSYFHFFLSPTMETGLVWPPYGVEMFDFSNVPLINTLILMTSGVFITISHNYLIKGEKKWCNLNLAATIILGVIFTILQGMEYNSSFFCIGDSTFGTTFFMLTGFHGIHVLIGTIFLITTLHRLNKIVGGKKECTSFELASWYWHFVDVVWIFLYFFLYYLNN